MKGSTIALTAIGIMNVGLMGLDHVAKKHSRKNAELEAIQKHSKEVTDMLEEVNKRCELFDDLVEREKKSINVRKEDWIAANGFNERKKDILDSVPNGLQNFKNLIGYYDKMQEIEDGFSARVEAFKNTIDYSANKAKYEKAIKEAKSHYDSQKALFDSASSDISEDAMKLRHAAEEAMNAKIKEAKTQLDVLEGQLNAEVENLTQTKRSAIHELEEKVSKEKIALDHKSDNELKALNDELSKAETDIRLAVKNERSEEEFNAVLNHEKDVRAIREQKVADADVANNIYSAKPEAVKIGEYLKAKKVPKFMVPVVGAIGLIPVGYLSFCWCKFITQVMRAMA